MRKLLLTSACPAVNYGLLYIKELERSKFPYLNNDDNYDLYYMNILNMSSTFLSDLIWSLNAIQK